MMKQIIVAILLFETVVYSCSTIDRNLDLDVNYQSYWGSHWVDSTLCIAQWNVGLLNQGTLPPGIPESYTNDEIIEFISLLQSMKADVLFLNECPLFLDQKQRISFSNSVSSLYPYTFGLSNNVRIFSRFPLIDMTENKTTKGNRQYIEATVDINNKRIKLVCFHQLPGLSNVNQRIVDNTELSEKYSKYEYVIMGGDTNARSGIDELQPFIDVGFSLGNMGIFGYLPTSPAGNAIDNIMVRGFDIKSCEMLKEKSVSDHFPIVASLSFI